MDRGVGLRQRVQGVKEVQTVQESRSERQETRDKSREARVENLILSFHELGSHGVMRKVKTEKLKTVSFACQYSNTQGAYARGPMTTSKEFGSDAKGELPCEY